MHNSLTAHVQRYTAERVALGELTPGSARTTRERLHGFARFHGSRPLNRLTEARVILWLESIGDRSVATRAAYLSSVRGFSRWMVAKGHIAADPCANIAPIRRPKRVPRALGPDAVAACLGACASPRDRAIVLLALRCGLRRAEITALSWHDYDDRSQTLRVTGKGSKQRIVPVPSVVASSLVGLARTPNGPIIAPERGSHRLTPNHLGRIVARIVADAGVKVSPFDGVSTHALRHTAASDVLDACGDLRVVQQMLGHEGLPSTAIYLRLARLEDLSAAMEQAGQDRAA
jgi:integrase/recombinase XerD